MSNNVNIVELAKAMSEQFIAEAKKAHNSGDYFQGCADGIAALIQKATELSSAPPAEEVPISEQSSSELGSSEESAEAQQA